MTPDRRSVASSITANRCNVPEFIPEGEVKTTESTTVDDLEEAFLADPKFGLELLHNDFIDRIARYIKSRLYGMDSSQKEEAIKEIYCNTMVSLVQLAKNPDFDWHDPLGIVLDIAHKRVADHFRVRKRSHKQDIDDALGAIAAALTGTQVEAEWRITTDDERARFRRVLDTAIATKLTPKEMDVTSCYVDYFEEFTPNNIYGPLAARVSERTGNVETAMTVKKQWQQAKSKLMRELAKNGFTFPDIEEQIMNSKREERAIDALFVSQLRSNRTDVESHTELNEPEREQLRSLGDDFVDRLFAGEVEEICGTNEVEKSGNSLCSTAFGLNRAKDIDKETKEELDQKRQEIIDRMRKEKEDRNDVDTCD